MRIIEIIGFLNPFPAIIFNFAYLLKNKFKSFENCEYGINRTN